MHSVGNVPTGDIACAELFFSRPMRAVFLALQCVESNAKAVGDCAGGNHVIKGSSGHRTVWQSLPDRRAGRRCRNHIVMFFPGLHVLSCPRLCPLVGRSRDGRSGRTPEIARPIPLIRSRVPWLRNSRTISTGAGRPAPDCQRRAQTHQEMEDRPADTNSGVRHYTADALSKRCG